MAAETQCTMRNMSRSWLPCHFLSLSLSLSLFPPGSNPSKLATAVRVLENSNLATLSVFKKCPTKVAVLYSGALLPLCAPLPQGSSLAPSICSNRTHYTERNQNRNQQPESNFGFSKNSSKLQPVVCWQSCGHLAERCHV